MMLEKFIEQYNGTIVNFDGEPDNGGQAVQLIAMWCQFIGLPYLWGNPADWWSEDPTDDIFYEHWNALLRAEKSHIPLPGDIIVFSPDLPGTDGMGHLSLFVRMTDTGFEGFDVNWGGKAAHLQSHNFSYVVGWYTPGNRAVLESRIPTPIGTPVPNRNYDVEDIDPCVVVIKNDLAPLYNLNDVSWDSFMVNTVSQADAGREFIAVAIAKHKLGGTFYMPDATRAEGYAEDDCSRFNDNVMDTTTTEDKEVGSEGFNAINYRGRPIHQDILPPVQSPSKTDTYYITDNGLPRYTTFRDAVERKNAQGTVSPGKYFVFKRLENVMHITQMLGRPTGVWINPADGQKVTHDWHEDVQMLDHPLYFVARENGEVVDLDGVRDKRKINSRQPVLIAGFIKGPDGIIYALPDDAIHHDPPIYYGIKRTLLNREKVRDEVKTVEQDMVITPSYIDQRAWEPRNIPPQVSFSDKIRLLVKYGSTLRDRIKNQKEY